MMIHKCLFYIPVIKLLLPATLNKCQNKVILTQLHFVSYSTSPASQYNQYYGKHKSIEHK